MNLYDKIKSPFEDEDIIKKLLELYSKQQILNFSDLYRTILKDNRNQDINDKLYKHNFKEHIYYPFLENDWEKNAEILGKSPIYKKVYERFSSFYELEEYINNLDANTKSILANYRDYQLSNNTELMKKRKDELQILTGESSFLISANTIYKEFKKKHEFANQGLSGFHFDSQKNDNTEIKEKPEIKFYLNAGPDTYKVARMFLDKCRENQMESYYFKVVDVSRNEHYRNDRLCIYSTLEHSSKFLEMINQIKDENPEINFIKPLLTNGTIDDFIGIGTDEFDKNDSYNEYISRIISDTFHEYCDKENIQGVSKLADFVGDNEKIIKELKSKMLQKAVEMGCSKEKICVTEGIAEKLKGIEMPEKKSDIENEIGKEPEKNEQAKIEDIPAIAYDENGNIIIKTFNPTLMKSKIKLPNGNEINASQYVQEIFAPYIPESGTFKLKNGNVISARQYIEEYVLGEGQTKYKGDIEALLKDTVGEDGDDEREIFKGQEPGHKVIPEEKKEDVKQDSLKGEDMLADVKGAKVTKSEFKKSLEKMKEDKEVDKTVKEYRSLKIRQQLGSLSPEEQLRFNTLSNMQTIIVYENSRQTKKNTGIKQNKDNGMSR